MKRFICPICAVFFLAASTMALAEQSREAKLLQRQLADRVPNTWQIHATLREGVLVGFVTPPYQEAFNLWYEPQKLQEKLESLCPGRDDAIWNQLPPNMKLVLQPTVGGKSADGLRVGCQRAAPPA